MHRAQARAESRISLPSASSAWVVIPVMLPPGLARLATNPLPTALLTLAMTIGMVFVARCSARVVVALPTTITSTFCPINSLAKTSRRFTSPSA